MSQITPQAASQREAARQQDGKFGTQAHPAPDTGLGQELPEFWDDEIPITQEIADALTAEANLYGFFKDDHRYDYLVGGRITGYYWEAGQDTDSLRIDVEYPHPDYPGETEEDDIGLEDVHYSEDAEPYEAAAQRWNTLLGYRPDYHF